MRFFVEGLLTGQTLFLFGEGMKIVERVTSRFNHVDVWKAADGYDFEVAGGTHATYRKNRIMTGYAWDAITAAALLGGNPDPERWPAARRP